MGSWVQPQGGLYNRDNNNFQPRIGFAWNVTPNTVVRGGWALMHLDMNLWYTNQSEIGGGSFLNTGAISQPNNVYTPLFHIDQGVPAPVYPPTQANGTIPSAGTNPQGRANGTLNVIPKDFHNPYTQNWNLSIQRAIKTNYLVELTYSGSQNVGFQGSYNWQSRPYATAPDANWNIIDLSKPENWGYRNTWVQNATLTQAYKPFPSWNGVNYYCNCITRIYHSGTVKMEKRASHGLTYLAFFTWQKGLENQVGNLYQAADVGRQITSMNQKFRFTSSMTYELPFGKGKKWMNSKGWMNWILGGYSFAWNYSQWTPTPTSISYSGASYVNPVTGVLGGRQDYPGYEPLPGSQAFLLQIPADSRRLAGHRWKPMDAGDAKLADHELRDGDHQLGQPVHGSRSVLRQRQHAREFLDSAADYRGKCVHLQGLPDQRTLQGPAPAGLPESAQVVQLGHRDRPRWPRPARGLFGTVAGPSDFNDSTEGGPPQPLLSFRVKF